MADQTVQGEWLISLYSWHQIHQGLWSCTNVPHLYVAFNFLNSLIRKQMSKMKRPNHHRSISNTIFRFPHVNKLAVRLHNHRCSLVTHRSKLSGSWIMMITRGTAYIKLYLLGSSNRGGGFLRFVLVSGFRCCYIKDVLHRSPSLSIHAGLHVNFGNIGWHI